RAGQRAGHGHRRLPGPVLAAGGGGARGGGGLRSGACRAARARRGGMVHRSRRTDGARLTLDYTARVSGALADDGAVLRALADKIRDVPNFPKEGILCKDITTLLQDAAAFRQAVDIMAEASRGKSVALVAGVGSVGCLSGGERAYR